MRIVAVTPFIPFPPDSGALMRTYHTLSRLAQRYRVDLLCLVHGHGESIDSARGMEPRLAALRERMASVQVIVGPGPEEMDPVLPRLRRLFAGIPASVGRNDSAEMRRAFLELVSRAPCDLLHLEFPWTAGYARLVDRRRTKVALSLHNVEYLVLKNQQDVSPPSRLIERLRLARQWRVVRSWEARALRWADLVLTPAPLDAKILSRLCPSASLEIVPNAVATNDYVFTPDPDNATLVFTGTLCYPPNQQGVTWLCDRVLPLVRKRVPQVRLFVVGRQPGSELLARHDGQGVVVTGRVPSVLPYLQQSTLSIVPLHAGSGTRLKVLEAMAAGRPVVSTSVGCQGLAVTHQEDICIADDAESFADSICALLGDRARRAKIAQQARRLVEQRYDWDMVVSHLATAYDALVGRAETQ